MKIFYSALFLFVFNFFATGQTVTVAGQCIDNPIILNKIADENGRATYQGTGTIGGLSSVVTMSWLASDNLWVLDFDGQAFYQNPCNTALPPKTDNGNASCPWTASGSDCVGAAPLSIQGNGLLPVKLVSFTADINNEKAVLNWKTSNEVNNKGFDIQRSRDGIQWLKIGFVAGGGESGKDYSYTYTDASPVIGKTYYRLNQLDIDEKGTVSGIVSVDIINGKDYTLASNTSRTGMYNLTVKTNTPLEISIVDFSGRKLLTRKATQGAQQLDISKYPSGIYLLQVSKANKIFTEKLIKN